MCFPHSMVGRAASSSGILRAKAQHGKPAGLCTLPDAAIVAPAPFVVPALAIPLDASASVLQHGFQAAWRAVSDAVVVESGLHVPLVNAAQCFEQYGLPSPSSVLPSAPPLQGSIEQASSASKDLGACLASPFDEEDLNNPAHQRASVELVVNAGARGVQGVSSHGTHNSVLPTLNECSGCMRRWRRTRQNGMLQMLRFVIRHWRNVSGSLAANSSALVHASVEPNLDTTVGQGAFLAFMQVLRHHAREAGRRSEELDAKIEALSTRAAYAQDFNNAGEVFPSDSDLEAYCSQLEALYRQEGDDALATSLQGVRELFPEGIALQQYCSELEGLYRQEHDGAEAPSAELGDHEGHMYDADVHLYSSSLEHLFNEEATGVLEAPSVGGAQHGLAGALTVQVN